MNEEREAEILIRGGGLGGVAAGLAALRLGHQTILASAHRWLGGQLTTQGVPPDEHPWIEMFGATESYRTLRRSVREYYRQHYPLTERARADPYLNPGNAWVSRVAHEPHVAARVIDAALAPSEASGDLVVLREHRLTRMTVDGDRVHAVTLVSPDGHAVTVTAGFVLDATELSLSLLYWLQTEAPRPDGGTGYPGLRLHRETFGTPDGMAHEPYVRESRRIRAEFTVREQHLSVAARGDEGPVKFADSVGVGAYRIDLHPSTGGDSYIDLDVWPF